MLKAEPTADQLASRRTLNEFIDRMGASARKLGGKLKSDWFGRPDEELKGWIERGNAIAEIKDSRGYKLIIEQVDREVLWAQDQLEICDEKVVMEFRMYLRALRFLKGFLLTTEKNADISGSILAGRAGAIGRETFVKNAVVGDRV